MVLNLCSLSNKVTISHTDIADEEAKQLRTLELIFTTGNNVFENISLNTRLILFRT
jgi:hypothetical protein